MIYVCLFFKPNTLKYEDEQMEEYLQHFGDNSVVKICDCLKLDAYLTWDNYPSAKRALIKREANLVGEIVTDKANSADKLLKTFEAFLSNGEAAVNLMEKQRPGKLLDLVEEANSVLKWFFLHFSSVKVKDLIEERLRFYHIFKLLLKLSVFERDLRLFFEGVAMNRTLIWNENVEKCRIKVEKLKKFSSWAEKFNEDVFDGSANNHDELSVLIGESEELVNNYREVDEFQDEVPLIKDINEHLHQMRKAALIDDGLLLRLEMSGKIGIDEFYDDFLREEVKNQNWTELKCFFSKIFAFELTSKRSVLRIEESGKKSVVKRILRNESLRVKFYFENSFEILAGEIFQRIENEDFSFLASICEGFVRNFDGFPIGVLKLDAKMVLKRGLKLQIEKKIQQIYYSSVEINPQKCKNSAENLTEIAEKINELKKNLENCQDFVGISLMKIFWQEIRDFFSPENDFVNEIKSFLLFSENFNEISLQNDIFPLLDVSGFHALKLNLNEEVTNSLNSILDLMNKLCGKNLSVLDNFKNSLNPTSNVIAHPSKFYANFLSEIGAKNLQILCDKIRDFGKVQILRSEISSVVSTKFQLESKRIYFDLKSQIHCQQENVGTLYGLSQMCEFCGLCDDFKDVFTLIRNEPKKDEILFLVILHRLTKSHFSRSNPSDSFFVRGMICLLGQFQDEEQVLDVVVSYVAQYIRSMMEIHLKEDTNNEAPKSALAFLDSFNANCMESKKFINKHLPPCFYDLI